VVGTGWRLTGASDHLVSEALYMQDAEGNGIEIYRDRPREQWDRDAGGEIRIGTVALDIASVMAELPQDADRGMPDGTIVGHIHLQVSELVGTEAFYAGELGLDVTSRAAPGALFMSRDGYHHHVGANTWASAGGSPPPEGARGLEWFEMRHPEREGFVTDPSGNRALLYSSDS
jgi:catechol 2,3-dioxygenase